MQKGRKIITEYNYDSMKKNIQNSSAKSDLLETEIGL